MRLDGLAYCIAAENATAGYDFGKSYSLRREAATDKKDDALQMVDEARNANTRTTLDMMDRHSEMVKKSMELFKIKEK